MRNDITRDVNISAHAQKENISALFDMLSKDNIASGSITCSIILKILDIAVATDACDVNSLVTINENGMLLPLKPSSENTSYKVNFNFLNVFSSIFSHRNHFVSDEEIRSIFLSFACHVINDEPILNDILSFYIRQGYRCDYHGVYILYDSIYNNEPPQSRQFKNSKDSCGTNSTYLLSPLEELVKRGFIKSAELLMKSGMAVPDVYSVSLSKELKKHRVSYTDSLILTSIKNCPCPEMLSLLLEKGALYGGEKLHELCGESYNTTVLVFNTLLSENNNPEIKECIELLLSRGLNILEEAPNGYCLLDLITPFYLDGVSLSEDDKVFLMKIINLYIDTYNKKQSLYRNKVKGKKFLLLSNAVYKLGMKQDIHYYIKTLGGEIVYPSSLQKADYIIYPYKYTSSLLKRSLIQLGFYEVQDKGGTALLMDELMLMEMLKEETFYKKHFSDDVSKLEITGLDNLIPNPLNIYCFETIRYRNFNRFKAEISYMINTLKKGRRQKH